LEAVKGFNELHFETATEVFKDRNSLRKAAYSALDLLGHLEHNYACGESNIKDACLELEQAINNKGR